VSKALTAVAVEKLKPKPTRYEMPEGGQRGLLVAVFPSALAHLPLQLGGAIARVAVVNAAAEGSGQHPRLSRRFHQKSVAPHRR
jgi:hypothetical protein